jgi:hypothetical protein
MDRQAWIRLAYSRPGGPILIVLLFTLCSTPFLLVGLALNTSYAPITSLTIYPKAQSLQPPVLGRVGMMGTPTTDGIIAPEAVPNYSFTTTDPSRTVLHFYLAELEKRYGAQGIWVEQQSSDTTVLHGSRRMLYNLWSLEQTRVEITSMPDGTTHITIMFNVIKLPRY